jgi:cytochrome b561
MNDQTIRPARSAVRRTPLPAPRPEARSNTTRVIHLLLLLAALHQLIGSQFIERPMPGDAPAWPYVMHEYVGLGTLGVVLAFWVWTLLRHGETRLGRLFPWISASGVGAVLADIAAQGHRLAKGRLPDEGDGTLASAIHGLGLLTITAMAVTGAGFFFVDGTALGRSALAVHRLLANLMWAYLIAHAGLAALHQLLGADMVARMFWGRSRRDAAPLKRPS